MACQSERAATCRHLAPLRDFFIARSADDLATAWGELISTIGDDQDFPARPAVPDWEAVEFSFNKLFVGPQPPTAPPFASLHLDSEPYVMGPSTLEARSIYRLLGLQSPLEGSFPDDHVSLELDALLAIQTSLASTPSPELAMLRDYFLERHMMAWIPAWCETVSSQEAAHPAIAYAARLLAHCLSDIVDTQLSGNPHDLDQHTADTETMEDNAS